MLAFMSITARCIAAAIVVPGALLWACGPECPEYWEPACQACGASSAACRSAKDIGRTLTDDARCVATTVALEKVLDEPTSRRRYCNRADTETDGDLDALTSGPWICEGRRVIFGRRSVKIDDALHEMSNVSIARFELRTEPVVEHQKDDGRLQCRYDLGPQPWSGGEVALALDCPPGLDLPTGWASCLREQP